MRRWQGAVLLPVDQIVLTLAQDLLNEPAELAMLALFTMAAFEAVLALDANHLDAQEQLERRLSL